MTQSSPAMIILIFLSASFLIASASAENDESAAMRDLYDFILQRESAQPIMAKNSLELLERKPIRSPAKAALRLRFGRTDPIATYRREFSYGVRKRPKSPSTLAQQRLRFGRNDPLMMTAQHTMMNENQIYEDDSMEGRKVQRAPIVRFRFGKRNSDVDSFEEEMNALKSGEKVEPPKNPCSIESDNQ